MSGPVSVTSEFGDWKRALTIWGAEPLPEFVASEVTSAPEAPTTYHSFHAPVTVSGRG